jgi:hypothetical protein
MERLRLVKGVIPKRIKVADGSEFISKALDKGRMKMQLC